MTDHALLQHIFNLEAQRTVELARLGRFAGTEVRLETLEDELAYALEALQTRNLRYPLHMVAGHYSLSPVDYMVLQVALLAHNSGPYLQQLTEALESPSDVPLLSHALSLLAPDLDDWQSARQDLMDCLVFKENLVKLSPPEADDPRLALSLSILELLGLTDTSAA